MFESNGEHLAVQTRHCHSGCEQAALVWRVEPAGEPTLIYEGPWSGLDRAALSPLVRYDDEIFEFSVYDFVHRRVTHEKLPRSMVLSSTKAVEWSADTPTRKWKDRFHAVRKFVFR